MSCSVHHTAKSVYKKTQIFDLGSTKMYVSGHCQTHLGWAFEQSVKKETDNSFVWCAIRTHFY